MGKLRERDMWVVLPVKKLAGAKTRLAGVMSPAERAELCLCMVQDVIVAARTVTFIDELVVVTRGRRLAQLAQSLGACALAEAPDDGHNEAVGRAAAWLRQRGEAEMLVIPGDIPMVTSSELSRVAETHRRQSGTRGALTIVPSRDREGSNCVVCSPPDLMPFLFGRDSFRRHIAAARDLGMCVHVANEPGIALDIDTPADLADFAARPGNTRTRRFLEESGIAQRVLVPPLSHDDRMIA